MKSSSDAENVDSQLGVIWGQILKDSRTEVKLGGWIRRLMAKMSMVHKGSYGVKSFKIVVWR